MDTIYALATPPGKSGVAVIRVSGAHACTTLATLGISKLTPRVATLAALRDTEGALIDKGLVLYFAAPHSFTGEDVVEYHIHGSRAVIIRLLAIFAALPEIRAAEPGEFTRRAFLNGKMDLTAAEGLADLIDAETEAQQKQALRLMDGDAALFYTNLRKDIAEVLALLEAYIDFPDEEIPEHVLADIDAAIAPLAESIDRQLAGASSAERIRDGVRIAIIGAPNVGKSSLMNWLAKREVAIVSHIAGTTRDVIEVYMNIEGYSVILSDTAGLREATEEIEQEGIRRSLERAKEADICIRVVDKEEELGEKTPDNNLVVFNKADLGLPASLPANALAISVKERTGLEVFMQALKERVAQACLGESLYVTHARHRAHLTQALAHLKRFHHARDAGLELGCEELRRAATEIGRITGIITADEVLGLIFSRFCIGK